MLKKTVLIICGIGITLATTVIVRYLNPSTTNLSTDVDQLQNTATQIETEIIATWLSSPQGMVSTDADRILIIENNGDIKEIKNHILQNISLLHIANINTNWNEWLMSITIDPDYTKNKHIYLCYAFIDSDTMFARVSRWTDLWNTITDEKIILDKLPAAPGHAWCDIAFGPDKKLYITVGDGLEWEKAQYPDYFNGKILRINTDWSNPSDNPYIKSAVRSIGLRNSQGIDRDSKWNMYASDQWPSIFDGQPGGDEINQIVKRWNYGRNKVSHEQMASWFVSPLVIYTPAIVPAWLHIYKWQMFAERKDNILIGMLKWQWVLRIQQDKDNVGKTIVQEKILDTKFGHIRYITEWVDGSIYIVTNNEDNKKWWDEVIRVYKK